MKRHMKERLRRGSNDPPITHGQTAAGNGSDRKKKNGNGNGKRTSPFDPYDDQRQGLDQFHHHHRQRFHSGGGQGYDFIDHHDGAKRSCLMMPCNPGNLTWSQRLESLVGAAMSGGGGGGSTHANAVTASSGAPLPGLAPSSTAAAPSPPSAAIHTTTVHPNTFNGSQLHSLVHSAATDATPSPALSCFNGRTMNATNAQHHSSVYPISTRTTATSPGVAPATAPTSTTDRSSRTQSSSPSSSPTVDKGIFVAAPDSHADNAAGSVSSGDSAAKSNSTVMLAKDFAQLSFQEQQQGHKDVIGEVEMIREDADFIHKSLSQLDDELSAIRRKVAYDKAVFLSPKYVQDPMLRLLFLRAERFDAGKTAWKLMKHFDVKLRLFGPDKLVKDIEWDDLDEDDKTAYLTGASQMSDKRDNGGRKIYFNLFALRRYKHTDNQLRAVWYMFMKGIQSDIASQRKGLAMVSYTLGTSPASFYSTFLYQAQQRLDAILPIRFTAMHFCFDDQNMIGPIFLGIMDTVSLSTRLRVRTHVGSHLECRYALASFGIPSEAFPLDINGNLLAHQFLQSHQRSLLEEARAREAQKKRQSGLVPYPTRKDVLLGRGHPYQKFEGNLRLLSVVEQAKGRYDSAQIRSSKTQISAEVVRFIQSTNGRFLRRDESEGMWVEVEDEIAREKVSMTFRNLSRKSKGKKAIAVDASSS